MADPKKIVDATKDLDGNITAVKLQDNNKNGRTG
jgi:hypothetical protein